MLHTDIWFTLISALSLLFNSRWTAQWLPRCSLGDGIIVALGLGLLWPLHLLHSPHSDTCPTQIYLCSHADSRFTRCTHLVDLMDVLTPLLQLHSKMSRNSFIMVALLPTLKPPSLPHTNHPMNYLTNRIMNYSQLARNPPPRLDCNNQHRETRAGPSRRGEIPRSPQ